MRFCEYITLHSTHGKSMELDQQSFYRSTIEHFRKREDNEHYNLLVAESRWYKDSRAYYKVWPSISPALSRVPLDVAFKDFGVHDRTILVRFPWPGIASGDLLLRAVLVSLHDCPHCGDFCLVATYGSKQFPAGAGRYTVVCLNPNSDATVESRIPNEFKLPVTEEGGSEPEYLLDRDTLRLAFKVAISVFLLADDPSIIRPDVLTADRDRFDNSTDPELRQRLIDKARKRGIVGWRIGEAYETIPHYRRPHFGLRYTGTGGTIPRIVPIKGAVVHRQKLTQVPTGYIRPDGTEAE